MGASNQTHRPLAELKASSTPKVYNIVSPVTANTEFSISLSSGTKKFMIRVREKAKLQFCFTSGQSGTTYITVFHHTVHYEEMLNLTATTLYMQVDESSQNIEILEWS